MLVHRDVVVNKILPLVLGKHRTSKGLGAEADRVTLVCRAAWEASKRLSFWLPWLVANRERFIEERCKGTAAAEVVRRQYVLVPELVMREAGVRGVVQCKQRVMRKRDKKTREEGWGTLVESHRVVEGWIKGGEARRDKAQLRWGKKRGGATFVAQQSGAAMEWTWGDGSVFRGGSDGQGTVETAHGEVLLMKRQEDTKNNSSKHERSVVVSKSGSPRSVVMRAGDVWGTAPSDWPVFGVAKEAES